jgi:hypothetical protein
LHRASYLNIKINKNKKPSKVRNKQRPKTFFSLSLSHRIVFTEKIFPLVALEFSDRDAEPAVIAHERRAPIVVVDVNPKGAEIVAELPARKVQNEHRVKVVVDGEQAHVVCATDVDRGEAGVLRVNEAGRLSAP